MKEVDITVRFFIREVSSEVCQQFKQPEGTWEVLGGDKLRWDWAKDEAEAVEKALQCIASDLSVVNCVTQEAS
jgi:hypothetical protein